jgi:DNA-binding Lrp family transcriptional regulator
VRGLAIAYEFQEHDGGPKQAVAIQVTNEKTMRALTHIMADEYSRRILLSGAAKAKTVEDFSREDDIPLSTCYRRVNEMHEEGILVVERIVISPEGKKSELYRSGFSEVRVRMADGNLSIEATVNQDIADKVYNMWSVMRWKET